ncbi:MAG: hypothetical protein MUC34_08830 [Anaerolineae bacterium]|nr:hypothetical protein [Anaerolineae bacterium]
MSRMRVMLEIGPKGKKVVAVAPDWPGLERGAKTGDAAIELLRSYAQRYAPVAELAGMASEFAVESVEGFDGVEGVDVVEQYAGTGSTDFWGISFAHSSIDKEAMADEALERELALMRACWTFFCSGARAGADAIGIRSCAMLSPTSWTGRRGWGCRRRLMRC